MSMDADTTYRVLTVYGVDAGNAKTEVSNMSIVLDHMINLAKEGAHVLAEMVEKIIDLGSKAETTRITIAGLFTAAGFKGANDFNTSLAMSSEIMKKMIADAARLPGTVEDLQEIFQGGIVGGQKAGKSIIDIEDISAKLMAVGKAFQMPAQMIRQEFAEMMEGRVRNGTPLFAKLKQFMGEDMNSQKFNAMSSAEHFEKILKAVEKFNPMIDAYASTWDVVQSTAQSYADSVLRVGSSGIFELMKNELAEINGWYEKNKEQIDSIAKKLGDDLAVKLKEGFGVVKDVVSFVIAHREAIISMVEGLAVLKGFSVLGGGGGFNGSSAAKAPGFGDVLGGGMFGLALSHLAGDTNIVSSTMMTLEGAMSQLPGIVGMVGKGLLGLHAGLEWIADQFDKRQKKDIEERGDIGDPMGILGNYDHRQASLDVGAAKNMASFLRAHQLVNGDSINENVLRQYLIDSEGTGAMKIDDINEFKSMAMRTAAGGFLKRGPVSGPEFGPGAQGSLTPDQRIQQLLAEAGKPVTTHTTNIGAVNLYTNIYDAEDPARVVQHLTDKIRSNLEHPAQSPSVAVHR